MSLFSRSRGGGATGSGYTGPSHPPILKSYGEMRAMTGSDLTDYLRTVFARHPNYVVRQPVVVCQLLNYHSYQSRTDWSLCYYPDDYSPRVLSTGQAWGWRSVSLGHPRSDQVQSAIHECLGLTPGAVVEKLRRLSRSRGYFVLSPTDASILNTLCTHPTPWLTHSTIMGDNFIVSQDTDHQTCYVPGGKTPGVLGSGSVLGSQDSSASVVPAWVHCASDPDLARFYTDHLSWLTPDSTSPVDYLDLCRLLNYLEFRGLRWSLRMMNENVIESVVSCDPSDPGLQPTRYSTRDGSTAGLVGECRARLSLLKFFNYDMRSYRAAIGVDES